jgi:integration host factor subunit alpha
MAKTDNKNLTKKDICKSIYLKYGIPKLLASKILDELLDIIIQQLKEEKNIKIKNFGSFFLKEKNKRIGRNPKTKELYEILKRNIVSFKIALKMKEKLNKHDN